MKNVEICWTRSELDSLKDHSDNWAFIDWIIHLFMRIIPLKRTTTIHKYQIIFHSSYKIISSVIVRYNAAKLSRNSTPKQLNPWLSQSFSCLHDLEFTNWTNTSYGTILHHLANQSLYNSTVNSLESNCVCDQRSVFYVCYGKSRSKKRIFFECRLYSAR